MAFAAGRFTYVPTGLVARPKMGFGIPIDLVARGPLKGLG